MSIDQNENIHHTGLDWAFSYLENAKNRLQRAKGFWKRIRNQTYSKLLVTYTPSYLAANFFKAIGRIFKGIGLLFVSFTDKPRLTFQLILKGIALESLSFFVNVLNIVLFLLPEVIKGIVLAIIISAFT